MPVQLDERLREREFGVLDRLTKVGIEARFPEQAAARAFLGKFFHRPPGGESPGPTWPDECGCLSDLRLDHAGDDVVVVTHQAVIMLFRYVLDGLDEAQLIAVDRSTQIANTAVSTYELVAGVPTLVVFNDSSHLSDASTTDASDLPAAPR